MMSVKAHSGEAPVPLMLLWEPRDDTCRAVTDVCKAQAVKACYVRWRDNWSWRHQQVLTFAQELGVWLLLIQSLR